MKALKSIAENVLGRLSGLDQEKDKDKVDENKTKRFIELTKKWIKLNYFILYIIEEIEPIVEKNDYIGNIAVFSINYMGVQ